MGYAEDLRSALAAGGLGENLYVYDSIDSTNTRAAELARRGAPAGTLVVADHQSRGRGRRGAQWQTPPGEAIAMSLILRPDTAGLRWTGLGAVAVVDALAELGAGGMVKWPNDVLINGRKAAGVLVETAWEGARLDFLTLGIGVNVGIGAAPPDAEVDFPATSVERETGRRVDRANLLALIVRRIDAWTPRLSGPDFLRRWESLLAFRGTWVSVSMSGGDLAGRLRSLGPEGEAILEREDGSIRLAGAEAASLRPVRK